MENLDVIIVVWSNVSPSAQRLLALRADDHDVVRQLDGDEFGLATAFLTGKMESLELRAHRSLLETQAGARLRISQPPTPVAKPWPVIFSLYAFGQSLASRAGVF